MKKEESPSPNNETLEEYLEELKDSIDFLRMVPCTARDISYFPSLLMLSGILTIILAYFLLPLFWRNIVITLGVIFIVLGLIAFYVDYRLKVSRDKNIYTFDENGFTIESEEGNKEFLPWNNISDFKVKRRGNTPYTPRTCTIKTENRIIRINLHCFIEEQESIKEGADLAKALKRYYKRII